MGSIPGGAARCLFLLVATGAARADTVLSAGTMTTERFICCFCCSGSGAPMSSPSWTQLVVCPIRLRINRRLPSRRKCLRRRVSHHHANHVCVCIRRSSPRTPPKASVVIVRLSILLVHRLGPPRRKRRVFVRILRRTTPVVRLFVDFDAPSPQPGQELRKLLWHSLYRPGGRFWSGAQGVVETSGLRLQVEKKAFFVSSRSQSRGDRRSPVKNEVDGTHSLARSTRRQLVEPISDRCCCYQQDSDERYCV